MLLGITCHVLRSVPTEPPNYLNFRRNSCCSIRESCTIEATGFNPYAYRWELTHHAAELQEKFADLSSGEEVNLEVAIAGRILARRVFGKLAFFSLQDETGTIQLYLDKKEFRKAWLILIQMLLPT